MSVAGSKGKSVSKGKPKDSPLWLHKASGNWARKIRGRVFYFGRDYDEALKKWAIQKDRLLAGLPVVEDRSPTLGELANVFIDALKQRAITDQLSDAYITIVQDRLKKIIAVAGRDARLQNYSVMQWDELRNKLFRNFDGSQAAPNTAAHRIECLRILLKWSNERELVSIKVPSSFKKPQKKSIREHRLAKKDSLWVSREDIRKLIQHADVHFKPVILLGLNCGLGTTDIARLTRDDVDTTGADPWLSVSRKKTGTMRHLWLWPETIEAIRAYQEIRPAFALRVSDSDRLLLTVQRQPWIDSSGNRVAAAFRRLRVAAGIQSRISHYSLRRALLTAIINLGYPEHLAKAIAGHEDSGNILLEHYVGDRDKNQIRTCLDSVRKWIFEDSAQ
jgi:integrase